MNYIDNNKAHILKINNEIIDFDNEPSEKETLEYRKKIEPWLSAIFQMEHLSLLLGAGLTYSILDLADRKEPDLQPEAETENEPQDEPIIEAIDEQVAECGQEPPVPVADDQETPTEVEQVNQMGANGFAEFPMIEKHSKIIAERSHRGKHNIEDELRIALELLRGYEIQEDEEQHSKLSQELNTVLTGFITNILRDENKINDGIVHQNKSAINAINKLMSFLISFSSRAASRDRLNIFTTNYDRLIELGLDKASIFTIDRFVGTLKPRYRSTKIDLDYHYNPPGIRGEPRYIEGVVRYYKIHGSIDWKFEEDYIVKEPIPFGKLDVEFDNPLEKQVIYPNSKKDIDTSFYPYADLFRDFSAALCRPNSSLVTFGYGYGDSHINRIITDMLKIPSTHLVIITRSIDDRLSFFLNDINGAQVTILAGAHFSDLSNLVDLYLPKAALDRISIKKQNLMNNRGDNAGDQTHPTNGQPTQNPQGDGF